MCCPFLLSCLQTSGGAAGVRAAILAEGFSSFEAFLDHAAAANKEHTERVRAERELWRLENEAKLSTRWEAALRRRPERIGNWGPQNAGQDIICRFNRSKLGHSCCPWASLERWGHAWLEAWQAQPVPATLAYTYAGSVSSRTCAMHAQHLGPTMACAPWPTNLLPRHLLEG
jgi:hypothetical protein